MKRFFILFIVTLVCLGGTVLAEQATLIDFSQLIADFPADNPTNNEATLLDFSAEAGFAFTDEEKTQMKTSLAINNWEVVLASSSRFIENQRASLVKPAVVRDDADQHAGETVMGIRVHFPTEPYNSWALIKPPFEIPAYADKQQVQADGTLVTPQDQQGVGDKYVNFGVVKNVGTLRSVSVNVRGLNYQEGLSVILQDENNRQQEIFLNYLNFDGWRTLTWDNPNYISEVRNRELKQFPLYPKLQPMRKLIGFRIYRDAEMEGGDFITYIKDVTVTFDKAVLEIQSDINNEAVWGILQERESARRKAELKRLGNIQVLRYLEQQKMHNIETQEQGATQGN